MTTYTLERITTLSARVNEAWDFFSNPENLVIITPPDMKFKVMTKNLPEEIYAGLLIKYTVRPLFGIPVNWLTEIKDVVSPHYFADEQKKGPYALWHHEHSFKEEGNKTIMEDKVTYALPYGAIGQLFHLLIVKKKLDAIFKYRALAIKAIFPD